MKLKGGSSNRHATAPSQRTAFGRSVERSVAEALEGRGYIVLGHNRRVGRDEVDVLALDGATLVIVEVRARSNGTCDEALLTVRGAKVQRLKRAALALLAEKQEQREVRIDVVAVGYDRVELLENAIDFTAT